MQPPAARLDGHEAQRVQVPLPLLVRHAPGADVVPGDGQQEGVGEVEVGVAHAPGEVVPDPQGQVEAVEALPREHGQVAPPGLAVVEEGEVLHVAGEGAQDAPHPVGRASLQGGAGLQGAQGLQDGRGIRGPGHPLAHFQQGVDQAPGIAPGQAQPPPPTAAPPPGRRAAPVRPAAHPAHRAQRGADGTRAAGGRPGGTTRAVTPRRARTPRSSSTAQATGALPATGSDGSKAMVIPAVSPAAPAAPAAPAVGGRGIAPHGSASAGGATGAGLSVELPIGAPPGDRSSRRWRRCKSGVG